MAGLIRNVHAQMSSSNISRVFCALLLGILPCSAATPADDLKAAIDRLAEHPNYSWDVKVESPPPPSTGEEEGQRSRRGGGGRGSFNPPSGKTEKDGFTLLKFQSTSNSTDVVLKGNKVAIQIGDEWQTNEEIEDAGEDGGFNRLRFTIRRAQGTKLPAAQALDLANGLKELQQNGDVYEGELKPETIKQMYNFRGGRRGGGGGGSGGGGGGQGERSRGGSGRDGGFSTDTSKLKGAARFWVKDGTLAKFQYHIEGKMPFGRDAEREIDVNRTTTFEMKNVGSTKLELPAEARKKLNKA